MTPASDTKKTKKTKRAEPSIYEQAEAFLKESDAQIHRAIRTREKEITRLQAILDDAEPLSQLAEEAERRIKKRRISRKRPCFFCETPTAGKCLDCGRGVYCSTICKELDWKKNHWKVCV